MQHSAPGIVQDLAPGLRGLIAPNPSPMTHWGTNTFLIGETELAVVDPGPDDAGHLQAILDAVGTSAVTHILVTHAHLDHSPLAARLSRETGAPVLAFGPAAAGQRPVMQALSAEGLSGGGEGVDTGFQPDATLVDGQVVTGNDWALEVLHTPGHFAGHLAFRWNDILLSGDHVMDWSSSLVSPPDGHLTDFMATSRRLQALDGTTFYPSHGGALTDPADRLAWLIHHREARETAILNTLTHKPAEVSDIACAVYHDFPAAMLPAAERNVFAHLIDLAERGLVAAHPRLSFTAGYSLV